MVTRVLQDPGPHLGQVYELTGPRSQSMHGVAEEYSRALGKHVAYLDVPVHEWMQVMSRAGVPQHLEELLVTMARLHRDNRYGRVTRTVEQLTGQPAQSVEAFVAAHAELFGAPAAAA